MSLSVSIVSDIVSDSPGIKAAGGGADQSAVAGRDIDTYEFLGSITWKLDAIGLGVAGEVVHAGEYGTRGKTLTLFKYGRSVIWDRAEFFVLDAGPIAVVLTLRSAEHSLGRSTALRFAQTASISGH